MNLCHIGAQIDMDLHVNNALWTFSPGWIEKCQKMSFENAAKQICKYNFKEMLHPLCKYAKFDVTCLNKLAMLKVQYHSSTNKLFNHKPLCCRLHFLPGSTMGQNKYFSKTVYWPGLINNKNFNSANKIEIFYRWSHDAPKRFSIRSFKYYLGRL